MVRSFSLSGKIDGEFRTLNISAEVNAMGYAITNEFRSEMPSIAIGRIFGESFEEFRKDCSSILAGKLRSTQRDIFDSWCDGLDHVLSSHINRCGRLFYEDLLVYVDCLAHMWKAKGEQIHMIKVHYPVIVARFVDKYMPYLLVDSPIGGSVNMKGTEIHRAILMHINNLRNRVM